MVQTESRSRSRRQRAEQAVAHALERRWDLAAEVNRALLQEEPDDIETANRLGKALTELGDLLDAAGADARPLENDPTTRTPRPTLLASGCDDFMLGARDALSAEELEARQAQIEALAPIVAAVQERYQKHHQVHGVTFVSRTSSTTASPRYATHDDNAIFTGMYLAAASRP